MTTGSNENVKEVINLTPHIVTIFDGAGAEIKTFPPSGVMARITAKTEQVGAVCGVPLTRTLFGTVQDLPLPIPGTAFIVSAMVMAACPDRADLLVPDMLVRDSQGRVTGCRALRGA